MSSMARMPKAPGLFSITTGWPRIGRMCSPTMRMTMSVALPGPNGTTTLTGLLGYLSCAASSIPPTARNNNERIAKRFMWLSAVLAPSDALVGQFDLHLGDGLAPLGELAVEPGLRLVQRGVRLDADELLLEGVLQRRSARRLHDRLVERGEDLFRRLRRREHALPVQGADAGIAGLGQGRHVGIVRQPRLRQHRDRPQLAGLDHRATARGIDERDLRGADDEVAHHARLDSAVRQQ